MTAPAFVKGLAGVVAAQTALSSVDGVNGVLTYRGLNIHDLAGKAQYEEVVYLLLYNTLPTATQLADFKKDLAAHRSVPQPVLDIIITLSKNGVPMDVLRTAVSALAFFDQETEDYSVPATLRKGLRLVAQFPALVAAHQKRRVFGVLQETVCGAASNDRQSLTLTFANDRISIVIASISRRFRRKSAS